ncbi:MAG: hypothetical protein HIU93_15115 [Acidobacteria bacterium]|nr:hypothetical protein [Acidobacteriota bacterium]
MTNPWQELRSSDESYILEMDREAIRRHNDSVSDAKKKVIVASIPEPFIGNPKSARLVLLGLNPGHSPEDEKSHRNPEFQNAMFLNLRQKLEEYPFYPLNPKPAFRESGAAKWWLKRTCKLQIESGLDDQMFAERLLVIEWFPYHSQRSGLAPKRVCASQEYSFQLARQMLQEKKLVVRMRSEKHWTEAHRQFGELPSLKNPQCGHVTRGNTEERLFEKIVKALKGTDN